MSAPEKDFSPLVVSDHALVRYLERMHGLDFDGYREEILSMDLKYHAALLGDGKYPIGDQCQAVIRNSVVVTVLGEYEEE